MVLRKLYESFSSHTSHRPRTASLRSQPTRMRLSRKHKKLGKVVVTVEVTGH
jgi:hypothetical protein